MYSHKLKKCIAQSLISSVNFGRVKSVDSIAVEVSGLGKAKPEDKVISETGIKAQVSRVSRESTVLLLTDTNTKVGLGERFYLKSNAQVQTETLKKNSCIETLNVNNSLKRQVIDSEGESLSTADSIPILEVQTPSALMKVPLRSKFVTGVKVMDELLGIAKGQRIAVIAGSGVGKTTLMMNLLQSSDYDVAVIALVGERGRELNEFLEAVENQDNKVCIVCETSDKSAVRRTQCFESSIQIALNEAKLGKDVLFIADSLTRYSLAINEVSARTNSYVELGGYSSLVYEKLPYYLEKLGHYQGWGAITSFLTVLAEDEEHNDRLTDTVRSIVDGHIVLSRELANKQVFPSIDLLSSKSRVSEHILSTDQKRKEAQFREGLTSYKENKVAIEVGMYEKGSRIIENAIKVRKDYEVFVTNK